MKLGYTILYVPDVAQSRSFFESAFGFGARELAPPACKPWGQTVSYLRAPDGTLVAVLLTVPTGGPPRGPQGGVAAAAHREAGRRRPGRAKRVLRAVDTHG